MERTEIVSLYKNTPADGTMVTVCGWAKNIRDSKNIGFIALSDGGCFKTLQVVLEAGKLENYEQVIHTGLYSSLRIVGRIVLTPQAKQPFELNAESVEILGDCPADEYPLQKKKMSMEYLRTMPTLRPRTNTFNAAERDAEVFEPLSKAYGMPRETEEEKAEKARVMEIVLKDACSVPMEIMEKCCEAIELIVEFGAKGSKLAISDAGVGAAFCKAALKGASLNVYINTKSMADREYAEELNKKADAMLEKYTKIADETFESVLGRLK